jgi:hypothetical protein
MSDPSNPSRPPADSAAEPTWSAGSAAAEGMTDLPPDPSDTPSTGKGGPAVISKDGFQTAVTRGVAMASRLVHRFAATPAEQEYGLWLADGDDLQDIAGPAASLVWRRIPAEARSSDLVDVIQLGFALFGYVSKNFAHRQDIRRQLAAGQLVDAAPDTAP